MQKKAVSCLLLIELQKCLTLRRSDAVSMSLLMQLWMSYFQEFDIWILLLLFKWVVGSDNNFSSKWSAAFVLMQNKCIF